MRIRSQGRSGGELAVRARGRALHGHMGGAGRCETTGGNDCVRSGLALVGDGVTNLTSPDAIGFGIRGFF